MPPINVTVNSVSELVNQIRQVNLQPNNSDLHTIMLSDTFSSGGGIYSPATGSDAELFGNLAFPVILRNLRILGNGKTISRNTNSIHKFRFFGIDSNSYYARLALENLGLTGGDSGDQGGGAILVRGAPQYSGYNENLLIASCYIYNNTCSLNGGAIYNGDGAKCGIYKSIFMSNTANGDKSGPLIARGGAIHNAGAGTLRVRDSTFAFNTVSTGGLGGAILSNSIELDVKNSAFTANSGDGANQYEKAVRFYVGTSNGQAWNWWGYPNGGGAAVFSVPYLSTLPHFYRPPSYPATGLNPCLPASTTVRITSFLAGAITRRGPNNVSPNIQDLILNTAPNATASGIPVRVRAYDESGATWVGFVDPALQAHRDYLSWIPYNKVTLSPNDLSSVPEWRVQSDNVWSEKLGQTMWLTDLPIQGSAFDAAKEYHYSYARRDFGLYPDLNGWHTGFDFFPIEMTPNDNVNVLASAPGIVVGIGVAQTPNVPPATWGAVGHNGMGYNIVIRTGKHFVLYGHLREIAPSLYLGARVGPGALLGKLITQTTTDGDNTHLHLEVRGFTTDKMSLGPVSCLFGAIKDVANAQPRFIDPLRYIYARGSILSTSADGTDIYQGTLLLRENGQAQSFKHLGYTDFEESAGVKVDTAGRCFDLYTERFYSGVDCDFVGPNCP
jgi:hypothetical protein